MRSIRQQSTVTLSTRKTQLSLSSGPEFEIYDIHTTLSEEYVGTVQSVELLVLFAAVQRTPADRVGIEFDDEAQPVFRGHVTDVDRTRKRDIAVLDAGDGTVLFYPDETNSEVNRDDSVQLAGGVRHLKQLR